MPAASFAEQLFFKLIESQNIMPVFYSFALTFCIMQFVAF